MDKNTKLVSHLDENLKNNPETNEDEVQPNLKNTIEKNREIIEKNREMLGKYKIFHPFKLLMF
ncbi:multidrug transporter [Ureibacillus chungkukjangi]|uniref:multidrug transporter n=1 Tax=Ureibacillus chungkukjangi TaxID=1202712 RepID=UPI00384E4DBB